LQKTKLIFVTGKPQSGKTSMVLELVGKARNHGLSVSGIACPGLWQKNQRSGFELLELDTGTKMLLSRRISGLKPVPFMFDAQSLEAGHKALCFERCKAARVVVVDEVGRLELADSGWAKSLYPLFSFDIPALLWVVRSNLVEQIKNHFNLKPEVFSIDQGILKLERRLTHS
jgi:nucleoside-triphosphatase THEP1